MTLLFRFLIYNLLASLIAGLISWLIVSVVVVFLDVRPITIKLTFLGLPLLKSSLVLLGIGYIFPWPRNFFAAWREEALSPLRVAPLLLIWSIVILSIYTWLVQRGHRLAMHGAYPASQAAPGLSTIFKKVQAAYRRIALQQCSNGICCVVDDVPRLELYVSDALASPVALTEGGRPAIIFPSKLLSTLDDSEVEGALAHEFAHFTLRRPAWWSASTLKKLTLINPIAGLLASNLSHEEEKACDEIAVAATGNPEIYASMLLKSYRLISGRAKPDLSYRIGVVPELLEAKTGLKERVQILLQPTSQTKGWRQNHLLRSLIWTILFLFFFIEPV